MLYASTERSADMLYFGRFDVPDPFIAFSARGKKIAVLNALEFGRAKKSSGFDRVLPLEPWLKQAQVAFSQTKPRAGAADCAPSACRKIFLPVCSTGCARTG